MEYGALPPPNIVRCAYSFILLLESAWKNETFCVSNFLQVFT